MKKIYSKPESQVIDIETSRILCSSEPNVYRGAFGQIPSLTQNTENYLA